MWINHFSSVAICFLFAYVPIASALTFDSPIAYAENFNGESSFPTAPEFDALGAGGAVNRGVSAPAPTLLATAVRQDVDIADSFDGIEIDFDHETISTLASDVGIRAKYSGLSVVGDGTMRLNLFMRFALDDDVVLGGTTVAAFFDIRRIGTFVSVEFRLGEEHVGPGADEFLTLTDAFLTPAVVAELLTGAPFTVDFEVDRAAATVRASIQAGSQPAVEAPPLAMTLAHDYSLTWVGAHFQDVAFEGNSGSVDLEDLQIFAEPHTFEPLLNLDVGSFWGVPDPSYGAAGAPGVWNQVVIGHTPLVDLMGGNTAMSATLTASLLSEYSIAGDDVRNLMSDWAADPTGWALFVDGLPQVGAYRVTYYAMASGPAETGLLSTNGLVTNSLPGKPGIPFPVTLEGSTYLKVETIADGGDLDLFADSVGTETQLSGVQIESTLVVPEAGFGVGLLAAATALAGVSRRRSEVSCGD